MRKRVLISLIALVQLLGASLVHAQEDVPPVDDGSMSTNCIEVGGIPICEGEGHSTRPCTNNASTGSAGASHSETQYAPYDKVVLNGGPNGEDCVTTGYRAVPAGVDPGVISGLPDRDFGDILATYPQCPWQPGSDSVESPRSVALRFWRMVPLPAPQPRIQPGRAITGKYAYLETRGTTSHTFTQPDTPFGPLEIVAAGSYYVDWGDGNRTGPYPYEGGPWRDGRIKHEYLWVGKYDVVVTERWTATWHFGAESGTLNELRTTGRIDDFPVEEIQAVIYSG